MRTNELIAAISADAGTAPKRLAPAMLAAFGVSALGAGVLFAALLGPRHDIGTAMETWRFPLKFVLTAAFGIAAVMLAMWLARPGAEARGGRLVLLFAAGLLAAAVAVELAVVPSAAWELQLVGRNWLVCLVHVPILSAVPLAAILIAMRRGAPRSPARLGAAVGLLAGAFGATFYAAHCPDDSPLFVAVWYTLAVGLVTLAGAAIGSRLLRW